MRTYSSDKLIFDLSEEDKDSKDSKSIENDDNKSLDNSNFNRLKRNTINYMNKKFNFFLGSKENTDLKSIFNGLKRTISIDERENLIVENDNKWHNIYIKTSLKDYCLQTIKIKERCLLLYDEEENKLDNIDEKIIIENTRDKEDNFYLIIPLYKINIEISTYI